MKKNLTVAVWNFINGAGITASIFWLAEGFRQLSECSTYYNNCMDSVTLNTGAITLILSVLSMTLYGMWIYDKE